MNPRQIVAPIFLHRTSYAVDEFAGDEGLRDMNAFRRDLHRGGSMSRCYRVRFSLVSQDLATSRDRTRVVPDSREERCVYVFP